MACPNEAHQCGYGHRRFMVSLEIRQAKSKQDPLFEKENSLRPALLFKIF